MRGAALSIAVAASPAIAIAGDRLEVTPFDEMTTAVVTPHRAFAKPLSGGPLRVLVIAPRWSQRETVELAQRFDLEYETVSLSASDALYRHRELMMLESFALYGHRRRDQRSVEDDLRDKLGHAHEVIVIADVQCTALPIGVLKVIEGRVRAGAGLVTTGQARSIAAELCATGCRVDRFKAAIALDALPLLRDDSWSSDAVRPTVATGSRLGEGRVLELGYPVSSRANLALTPNTEGTLEFVADDYDRYHALLGRAVLWASGRPVAARITELTAAAMTIDATVATDVEVRVQVHDRQGRLITERRVRPTLVAGANEVAIGHLFARDGASGPALSGIVKDGTLFVDVTVHAASGAVVDWGFVRHEQRTDVAIGDVHVDSLALVSAELHVEVQLRGAVDGCSLVLEVTDALGRVVGRRERAVTSRVVQFRLDLSHPATALHRVDVHLRDAASRLRDEWTDEVTVHDAASRRARDRFQFVVWSSAHANAVRAAILRQLRAHGVDAIDLAGVTRASGAEVDVACRNVARAALRAVPYVTRIAGARDETRVREPCLTDPEHVVAWTAGLAERARAASWAEPLAYTLGDESYVARERVDACVSPSCSARFEQYLRDHYRTLDALNSSWGSALTAWSDATAITLNEAERTGQHARWADHRRYMEGVFTDAHRDGRAAIRAVDDGARVGFDGLLKLNSWRGYDFYELTRATDLNQVYGVFPNQVEYVRSFARPGALLGAWYHRVGQESEAAARRYPWYLVLHGFDSGWFWTSYNVGSAALYPDLRPTPQLEWMAASHSELKRGYDRLLLGAHRRDDGIAIHYSQASLHAATLAGRELVDAHLGAMALIEDLGLQYDFVASPEIESGALDAYRVLVLPASRALTVVEADRIRQFVRDGGLLIADIEPGVADGRCRPLSHGAMLADVTMRDGSDVAREPPACLEPVPYGAGRSIVLGYPFDDYRAHRPTVAAREFRRAVRSILDDHGITPVARITTNGEPFIDAEVVVLEDTAQRYLAIQPDARLDVRGRTRITVDLDHETEVFDLRARRRIGRVDRFEAELMPDGPLLYSLDATPLERLAVRLIAAEAARGEIVEVEIEAGGDTGTIAIVDVEIVGPDGVALEHLGHSLDSRDGPLSTSFRLALNEPVGTYTVRVTEIVSGQIVTADFEVRE